MSIAPITSETTPSADTLNSSPCTGNASAANFAKPSRNRSLPQQASASSVPPCSTYARTTEAVPSQVAALTDVLADLDARLDARQEFVSLGKPGGEGRSLSHPSTQQ